MKKRLADGFVRRMDHVVWKVVEGKGILLNLDDGAYFDVDSVGLSVWQLCDGRTTLNQIALRTGRMFKTDLGLVSRDVHDFIRELKRRRLVEIVSTPTRAVVQP